MVARDKAAVPLGHADLERLDAACLNVEAAISRFEDLAAGLRSALGVMREMRAKGLASQSDQAALAAAFGRDWKSMTAAARRAWGADLN